MRRPRAQSGAHLLQIGVVVSSAQDGQGAWAPLRRWPRELATASGGCSRGRRGKRGEGARRGGDWGKWFTAPRASLWRKEKAREGLESPGRRGGVHGVLGSPPSCFGAQGRRRQNGEQAWAAGKVSWAGEAQVGGPLLSF